MRSENSVEIFICIKIIFLTLARLLEQRPRLDSKRSIRIIWSTWGSFEMKNNFFSSQDNICNYEVLPGEIERSSRTVSESGFQFSRHFSTCARLLLSLFFYIDFQWNEGRILGYFPQILLHACGSASACNICYGHLFYYEWHFKIDKKYGINF